MADIPFWQQQFMNPAIGPPGGAPMPDPGQVQIPQFALDWGLNLFGGGGEQAPAPAPGTPDFGTVAPPEIPFPTGGGASVERFNPEAMPYRAERQVDPALASREQYAQGRLGRIESLVRDAMSRQQGSPWDRNVWQRLLAIAGPLSSARPGEMGAMGAAELARWNELHDSGIDRRLRLELGLEDERGRSAEAGFARQSGEHTAREGTASDRFAVDTANTGARNTAGQQYTSDRNRASISAAETALRLAIARYEQQQEERNRALALVLPQGGPASLRAYAGEAGRLGPEIGQSAAETQARRGLAGLITNEAALAGGNANNQLNRVHAAMERIAGGAIPRPPRARGDTLSPEALARHYARYVPLDSPEVMNEFPGFAGAE